MGKIKDWVIQMEEDAAELTRDAWIKEHGEENVAIYDHEQGRLTQIGLTSMKGSIFKEENWK